MECWGDAQPKKGYYAVMQPVIHPLFATRPLMQSLANWSGTSVETGEDDPCYVAIKALWEKEIFPKQSKFTTFRGFWDSALQDGFVQIQEEEEPAVFNLDVSSLAGKINRLANSELEILFYEPMGVGNGVYANNPWLQECPIL